MEQHPRLVVTGGRGQLGRALGARVPDAVLLDIDELDLTDREAVVAMLGDLRPQTIIHGGAYTAVDAAESDPEGARAVNAGGTSAVAEAAAAIGAKLVYISTDYVFGGTLTEPYPRGPPHRTALGLWRDEAGGRASRGRVEHHLTVRTSWVFGDGKNFISAILARPAPAPS